MSYQATAWAYAQPIDNAAAKFVLVALANFADEAWSCFPGQDKLADMTSQSVRSVQRHLEYLEAAGYLVRQHRQVPTTGVRTSDRYQLPPPLPDNLSCRTGGVLHDKTGGPTRQKQGVLPDTGVVCEQSVEPSGELTNPTGSATTAQTVVADWIDRCAKRPPGKVIGHVAKIVGELLAEGTDPDDIRQGLDLWQRKGLHPSTLASVVNEAMNSSPYAVVKPKPSTTDQRVNATLELARHYEREELLEQTRGRSAVGAGGGNGSADSRPG